MKGRGGRDLYFDIAGQWDTPFRFLNPQDAVAARMHMSVQLLRMAMSQKTWTNEPIPNGIAMARTAATSLLPIPLEQSIQSYRDSRFATDQTRHYLAEGEGRLGGTGHLMEGWGGINLRAEGNLDYRNRVAEEIGFTSYEDAEPYQKDIVNTMIEQQSGGEFAASTATGARRGQEWATYQQDIQDVENAFIVSISELPSLNWPPNMLMNAYFRAERSMVDQKKGVAQAHDLELDTDSETRGQLLMDEYYSLGEQATTQGNNFDFREFTELKRQFLASRTESERQYILRNTNRTEIPTAVLNMLRRIAPDEYRQYMESRRARQIHEARFR